MSEHGDDERAEDADRTAEAPPLSSLRERVEAERAEAGGSDGPLSELAQGADVSEDERSALFEEVDVGDIDGEAVWDAIVEGDAEELLGGEPRSGAEPTGETAEHVVDKREYCQRCEFFSDPPEATCRNEGTEIVELVDGDRFRVRGCPKVADDDEALGDFAREE